MPSAIPIHFLVCQMNASAHFNRRSPRGERPSPAAVLLRNQPISIHAPRGGSDGINGSYKGLDYLFQSTLPARGATTSHRSTPRPWDDFNPRSPRGERLAGSERSFIPTPFQSTLPARGATAISDSTSLILVISIHAPREGSDRFGCPAFLPRRYFNPRSPRGERRRGLRRTGLISQFQSTLPARGATLSGYRRIPRR